MSNALIQHLEKLKTIREKSTQLLALARKDQLNYFGIDDQKFEATANYVSDLIIEKYPSLEIPYHSRWRHFEAGGIDRTTALRQKLAHLSAEEQGQIFYELTIISVLLDAGAGKDWSYLEKSTGVRFERSEGLALASLELYLSGAFSSKAQDPLRVDREGLLAFSYADLAAGFDVTEDNPLEGIEGRLKLLNRLGKALKEQPEFFGKEGRLGHFYCYLTQQAKENSLSANTIFHAVLTAFRDIWPERLRHQGVSLGDVWTHSALKTQDEGSEYIPFHKLSQWLCYSLLEPLEWAGIEVKDIQALTGLPEYRNGGLLIDMGLIRVKDQQLLNQPQHPESEAIVEWRALTVALLDELASHVRQLLHKDENTMPLAKILQGGTWEAGRKIAKEKRPNGTPPIEIISDGTVF